MAYLWSDAGSMWCIYSNMWYDVIIHKVGLARCLRAVGRDRGRHFYIHQLAVLKMVNLKSLLGEFKG